MGRESDEWSSPDRGASICPWIASHLFPPSASGTEIRLWPIVSAVEVALGHPENNSVAWIMPGRLLASQNSLPVSVALGRECWVKLLVSLPNNPS